MIPFDYERILTWNQHHWLGYLFVFLCIRRTQKWSLYGSWASILVQIAPRVQDGLEHNMHIGPHQRPLAHVEVDADNQLCIHGPSIHLLPYAQELLFHFCSQACHRESGSLSFRVTTWKMLLGFPAAKVLHNQSHFHHHHRYISSFKRAREEYYFLGPHETQVTISIHDIFPYPLLHHFIIVWVFSPWL